MRGIAVERMVMSSAASRKTIRRAISVVRLSFSDMPTSSVVVVKVNTFQQKCEFSGPRLNWAPHCWQPSLERALICYA